jgi:hypothetical protein
MTETMTELKATITNQCQCQQCEECGIAFFGDYAENCPECNKEPEPVHYCTGECWEDQTEGFVYLFEEWEKANGSPEYCYIEGRRMGWRGTSGHTAKLEGWKEVLESLTGNFDFTLRCTFDPSDGSLTIVRSSHDEYGAGFNVKECQSCWFCNEGMLYDEVEGKWTDLGGYTECSWRDAGHEVTDVDSD